MLNDNVQSYVDDGGVHCLYCHGDDTEAVGGFDIPEGGTCTMMIRCKECHNSWYDVYKLSNVWQVSQEDPA